MVDAIGGGDMAKTPVYTGTAFYSIRECLDRAVADCPDKDAYRFRAGRGSDEIVHVTYRQFYDLNEALGASLTNMGFGSSHIACVGENSFKWICVYITVLKSAGVFVPIDKDLPTADKLHLLTESESEILFYSGKFEKWVQENQDALPGIKYFIGFDRQEDDGRFLSYSRLVEEGKDLPKDEYDALKSDPDELKYLVYTSGTTGTAKGVMLTERNICSDVHYGLTCSHLFSVGLSVLPYHHTYEAVVNILGSMHNHATLCINQNMREIVKDMQLFHPEYTFLVPAIAQFMVNSFRKNIRQQGKEEQFERAIWASKKIGRFGIDIRRIVFKAVHEVFGGNMQKILCGGAYSPPELGEFFSSIGLVYCIGYGITECSPLVAGNPDGDCTPDTVGFKLDCLELRLDDPNEEGIGEICVKGDTVMKGYYKNPEATAEAIKDGWFYTGDYGKFNETGHLMITGRKKNIIVLDNGKNIYPEELENYINRVPYIEEVVVRGVKNEQGIETELMAEVYLGEEGEHTEVEILADIWQEMKELPSYKMIRKVVIREEPFPKTTTNKIRRNV